MTNYTVYVRSWLLWAIAFVAFSLVGLFFAVIPETFIEVTEWITFILWVVATFFAYPAAQVASRARLNVEIDTDKLILTTTRRNIFIPDTDRIITYRSITNIAIEEYLSGGCYLCITTADGKKTRLLRREHILTTNHSFMKMCILLIKAVETYKATVQKDVAVVSDVIEP
jgi:hypothetical protein